ncbi:MAG: helicase-related protein [Candidatus Hodarchaeales archaeon]
MTVATNITLTKEQEEVLETIYKGLKDCKSFVVNMPYGTGKTIIGLELIETILNTPTPGQKQLAFYTSGGDGGNIRVHQAKMLAKEHGYPRLGSFALQKRRYKQISKSDRFLLKQLKHSTIPSTRYKEIDKKSSVFLQITQLMKEMRGSLRWNDVKIVVIDEIDEIAKRDFEGYRGFALKDQFKELFEQVKKNNIPVIGLTATADENMLGFICKILGTDKSAVIGQSFESPYKYDSTIKLVNDAYVEKINGLLREGIQYCIGRIAKITGTETGDLFNFIYHGLSKVFMKKPVDGMIKLNLYRGPEVVELNFDASLVNELKETKRELNLYSSSRIILLNSTPDHLFSVLSKSYFLKNKDLNSVWVTLEEFIDRSPENESVLLKGGRNAVLAKLEELSREIDDRWLQIFLLAFLRAKRPYLQGKMLTTVFECRKLAGEGKKKVLLITRFITMAISLKDYLSKEAELSGFQVACLTGQDSPKRREEVVDSFRNGDTSVLVLNKLGSKGLDLKAADCVIHVDIDSNSETMKQRRERIRGGEEMLLVYARTGEGQKIKDYILKSRNKQLIEQYKKLDDVDKLI